MKMFNVIVTKPGTKMREFGPARPTSPMTIELQQRDVNGMSTVLRIQCTTAVAGDLRSLKTLVTSPKGVVDIVSSLAPSSEEEVG